MTKIVKIVAILIKKQITKKRKYNEKYIFFFRYKGKMLFVCLSVCLVAVK